MGESKLTREEMETHVWGNAASAEWEIHTADPKDIRRMDKLGYPVVEQDEFGKRYKVPRRAIRFGRIEKRKLSPDELEARLKRLPKRQSVPFSSHSSGASADQSAEKAVV